MNDRQFGESRHQMIDKVGQLFGRGLVAKNIFCWIFTYLYFAFDVFLK